MTEATWEDRLFGKQSEQNGTPRPTTAFAGQVHPYAAKALEAECAAVAATVEGARDDELNKAALRMGRHVGAGSIDLATVHDALYAAGRASGQTHAECERALRLDTTGGLVVGQRDPRYPPERDPTPDVTVLALPPPPDELEAFWKARPFLQDIYDWARARRVSPWAVLGCALARIVTATPYFVALPPIIGGHASLNLFVGLVGASGTGKGAAVSVAREAVDVGPISQHMVGSGEGIAHGYKKRTRNGAEWLDDKHAVLFNVAEIDALSALGARQGATLLPQLRSAWSGEQLGFGYADPAKRLMIEEHQYRLCLVAGIQPGRAATLLEDTDGGTPQRFLWLPAVDPDAPDTPPPAPKPFVWTRPTDLGYVNIAGLNLIDVCDTARDTIIKASLARLRLQGAALDGHALLTRLKVAAALGLSETRLEASPEDWELSGVIMAVSDATRTDVAHVLADANRARNTGRALADAERAVVVNEHLEEAAVKRVCTSVLRILRRTPGEWVSHRSLRNSLSRKATRDLMDVAIDRLAGVGQVEVDAGAGDQGADMYRTPGDAK